MAIRIGVIGDFNPAFPGHVSIERSLQHAAAALGIAIEATWLPTPSVIETGTEERLAGFDGLWASPGSPYRSFDGMLRGIEFARRRHWPLVAT
jgi:CTP synthase (UTP-ammonia lyase)